MGKSSGNETQVKPPGFVKGAGKDLAGAARDVYQQGPLQYPDFPTYAGLTDPQQQGVQEYINFANQTFPGLSNQIFGSFGNALDAGNIYTDPSVQAGLGTIESRANRNFAENILPRLRQQATGTGNAYSSKAEQSERLAGRDMQQVISDAQAQFLGGQLGSARQLQGAGLATAPQTLGTGLFGGQALQNAGGVLQQDLQNQINADIQRWMFEQEAPGNLVNQYANQLSPLFGGAMGGTTTTGGGSNTLGNVIGGGLLGYSAASPFIANPMVLGGATLGSAVLGGLLS